jgi:hypothetical protein
MITLETIKTRLQAQTSYTIAFARDREVDLQEQTELPIVYLGYATIDSKNPTSPVEHDFLNQHGEDLVQSFHIQTVCAVTQLPTVWKALHTALIGWNPTPGEQYHSGFTYAQGGVMGLSNSKVWWLDVFRIGFPTVNVNFN